MRHRLSGLSTYGIKDQCVGDWHPTYAPLEYGPPFRPTLLIRVELFRVRITAYQNV